MMECPHQAIEDAVSKHGGGNGHHKGTRDPNLDREILGSGPRASSLISWSFGPDMIFRSIYQWCFQKEVSNYINCEKEGSKSCRQLENLESFSIAKHFITYSKTLKILQGLRPWTPLTHPVSLHDRHLQRLPT